MNPIKSCPHNLCDMVQSLSKSPSLDSFLTIKQDEITNIKFEGDGPLGILFMQNDDELMEVAGILENTVGNEYHELEIGMIVQKVNNFEYKDFLYENYMKLIGISWKIYGEITFEFTKPIKNDIQQFLLEINCESYYELFEELGAKTYDDLKYIEDTDLVNISKSDTLKIKSSIKKIHSEIFVMDSP